MFDGLKTCSPRHLITYFESSETAAVPTKIHQPRRLHQSPCCVPGTRRTKATPLPVSSALAGHMMHVLLPEGDRDLEHARSAERDEDLRDREPEVERDLADTCSDMITAARCRRGSLSFGSSTG